MKQQLRRSAVIGLLVMAPIAIAQEPDLTEVEQRVQEIVARLNLSEAQIEEISPVLRDSMEKRQSILESYGIDLNNPDAAPPKLGMRKARSMRQEMMAVRNDTRSAVEDVLTDEQMEEFVLIQEERNTAMRERMRAARQP